MLSLQIAVFWPKKPCFILPQFFYCLEKMFAYTKDIFVFAGRILPPAAVTTVSHLSLNNIT